MNDPYVLSSTVTLTVTLAIVYFVCFSNQRRDEFRGDIRRIRDELFDFMWQNGITYDSDAYRQARQSLNTIIQVANALSIGTLAIAVLFRIFGPDGFSLKSTPTTKSESPILADAIDSSMKKAAFRFVKFLFLEGFTGLLLRMLFQLITLTAHGSRFLKKAQDRTNALVYALGTPSTDLGTGTRFILARLGRVTEQGT